MMRQRIKSFNLDNGRPKVLLVGNGLIYGSSVPWMKLIQSVSRDGVDISRYTMTEGNDRVAFLVPNTVLTLATSITDDKERHEKYVDVLKENSYPANDNIDRLMRMPFDAVLTTNYTYELEASLNPKYPSLKPERKREFAAITGNMGDPKYLLHMFNLVRPEGPDIWHIHGELRRPSSIILSHDEYARFTHKILEHNTEQGNAYYKYKQDLKLKSWVDYFVVGDVYVLGLSFDYAEFDLWWLLGRRLREKTGQGEFVFYEPLSAKNQTKQQALSDSGVFVETCNVNIDSGGTYDEFYKAAIEDIENRMNRIHN